MTTEAKEKKAPDYSESAENLCNPSEVYELLVRLHGEQVSLEGQREKLRAENENLIAQIELTEQVIAGLQKDIREAIETYGSFQDTELGYYGIKYRRMIKSYHAEAFNTYFSKFASAVVEETINVKALEGLIKGKLIDETELKQRNVITEETQFAFVIR